MSSVSFQAQLLSIVDIVAKAAAAEIKRRVEESCAGMRLELSRSRKDIDALKRKCVMMDSELRRVRGRGRRRVWMCGSSDRVWSPLKTIRDQDQNPGHTHNIQQSVCPPEDETRAPAIKQERQEQETGGNEPLTEAQDDMENQSPVFGAPEIQSVPFTLAQVSAGHPEPAAHDEERLEVKSEEEEEEENPASGVHLRFDPRWTSFPAPPAEPTPLCSHNPTGSSAEASRNSLRPVETQTELHEAGRIGAGGPVCGAFAQQHQNTAPALHRGPSASVRRLRTHWRSSADAEKRFSCSFCERSFSRFSQLKEHLRSHTGEKPFTCAQCGRSFTKHCNLIRHAVVHSGEKPYQCGQCGKRFTQRSSLKSHQRMHADAWDHR